MRAFKSAFAPTVAMCAGLNPCNGNLFLGVEGMERTLRMLVGAALGRGMQGWVVRAGS